MRDGLLDANEVGELSKVPVSWVRQATRSRAMPCVRLGRYVRCDLDQVEAWLEACRQAGGPMLFRGDGARLR